MNTEYILFQVTLLTLSATSEPWYQPICWQRSYPFPKIYSSHSIYGRNWISIWRIPPITNRAAEHWLRWLSLWKDIKKNGEYINTIIIIPIITSTVFWPISRSYNIQRRRQRRNWPMFFKQLLVLFLLPL